MTKFRFPVLAAAIFGLSACTAPMPPPDGELAQGMADVLIDTGLYARVAITRTIGKHYNDATNTWKVLVCYQFVTADDTQGTNCIDSISAFKLDNGTWIVAVTVNNIYRWRAINLPLESQDTENPGQTEERSNEP